MTPALPFVRESGQGPGVVCLHANASSSGQWRGLLELLAPRFRVFAPDGYGAGKSPDWPSDRRISLDDEVRLIEPVLAQAGSPFALVGHSYGAATALLAALRHPGQVRAMALYEPTLFALIDDDEGAPPHAADGIRAAVAAGSAALDAGEPHVAAEHFIDYWMGPGSWRQMPAARQAPITESVRNVRRWSHALFHEAEPLEAFRRLDMPILYMVGAQSPRAGLAVAEKLTAVLPHVEVVELPGLGHMGPVTHPEPVNAAIERFLRQHHAAA